MVLKQRHPWWWLVAAVVVVWLAMDGDEGDGGGDDNDDIDGGGGCGCRRRWWRRVVANGVVDLVDPGWRSVFEVRRKSSLEKFSAGGGQLVAGGGCRKL
nr:hypothetical protein [Tanacetum cinerariifolium]